MRLRGNRELRMPTVLVRLLVPRFQEENRPCDR